ncbi:MAG: ABC transporter ATP-binding protein, partial [Streptosporangiaceae bacterium]|nr:ABC transporter ATP-binding protein [Streptosporangiaceae bacterium]
MLDADVEVDRPEFTVRARLRVAPGERLALFGPSGAGKTTLLEAIAGLVPLRRGRISLADRVLSSTEPPVRSVPPWQRRVGLLRQDPGLFPHLSVRDNLRYAPAVSEPELLSLAAVLGIERLLAVMPARLSGGQAHRVALGRLLLAHCDTLLLDEPYTGLDAGLRRTLTELVGSLVVSRSVPAVLVSHELADAQAFADRLAVLDRGQLLQVGAPGEVVRRPGSRRVAELAGYLGFVPAGGDCVAGVHPERVIAGAFGDQGLVLAGAVTAVRPAGAGWEASLKVGDAAVTCRLPEQPPPVGSKAVVTVLDPPYFGPDGQVVSGAPGGQDLAASEQGRRLPERGCAGERAAQVAPYGMAEAPGFPAVEDRPRRGAGEQRAQRERAAAGAGGEPPAQQPRQRRSGGEHHAARDHGHAPAVRPRRDVGGHPLIEAARGRHAVCLVQLRDQLDLDADQDQGLRGNLDGEGRQRRQRRPHPAGSPRGARRAGRALDQGISDLVGRPAGELRPQRRLVTHPQPGHHRHHLRCQPAGAQ